MAYKAVIFDLDGTLVHTMPEHRYLTVGQTLKKMGTNSSKHYIDRFWFETRRDDIIKEHFEVDVDLFWKTFRQYDTTDLRKQLTRVYDDTGFVKELKQNDYKVGIVTGAPLHVMSLEVDMIGKEYFDAVVRAQLSSGIRPKPDPHGIEECLSILGVKKEEAVYVGNADEDVSAAKNAQVFDVLVLRNEHEFPDIKPSLTVNSLYELRELL